MVFHKDLVFTIHEETFFLSMDVIKFHLSINRDAHKKLFMQLMDVVTFMVHSNAILYA